MLKDSVLQDNPFYDEVRETIEERRTVARFNYAGKSGVVNPACIKQHRNLLLEASSSKDRWSVQIV